MPIESTSTMRITCDNPKCPGNSLDRTTIDEWLVVLGGFGGRYGAQLVFCSYGCLSAVAAESEKTPEGSPWKPIEPAQPEPEEA